MPPDDFDALCINDFYTAPSVGRNHNFLPQLNRKCIPVPVSEPDLDPDPT